MPRRRWIKLWTQETLYGSTAKELEPAERAVWFGLLCLAGDSPQPGVICVAPNIPYTNEQMASILNVTTNLLLGTIPILEEHKKIQHNGTGCLEIINWDKYQPNEEQLQHRREYMAGYMRGYRKKAKDEEVE